MEANEGTSAPQHLRQHGIQAGDVADAVAWIGGTGTKDPQRENPLPSIVDLVRELRDED